MTLIKCDKLRRKYMAAVCVLIAFVSITVLHNQTSYFSTAMNGSTYLNTTLVDNEKISKTTSERVYIPDNYTGIPCKYTLNLPLEKRLEKIASYEFEGIENYIEDLFPDTDDQILPQEPVFVTAFSSNHFEEGLAMIYNFNKMINKNKTFALFVYDIGLTIDNVKQLVAREHPFVVWMDASIRFKTSNSDVLLERTREQGVLVAKSSIFQKKNLSDWLKLKGIPVDKRIKTEWNIDIFEPASGKMSLIAFGTAMFQGRHLPKCNLTRINAIPLLLLRIMKNFGEQYGSGSDCVYTQFDLELCWAQPYRTLFQIPAHFY